MKRRLCWGVLVLLVAAVRCSLEEGPGVDGPLDEEASYTILWSQAADTGLDLPQVHDHMNLRPVLGLNHAMGWIY